MKHLLNACHWSLPNNERPEWRQPQNLICPANQHRLTSKRVYHSGFISKLQRFVWDIMNVLNLNGFEDLPISTGCALRIKQTVECCDGKLLCNTDQTLTADLLSHHLPLPYYGEKRGECNIPRHSQQTFCPTTCPLPYHGWKRGGCNIPRHSQPYLKSMKQSY